MISAYVHVRIYRVNSLCVGRPYVRSKEPFSFKNVGVGFDITTTNRCLNITFDLFLLYFMLLKSIHKKYERTKG